jgi:hypothetical protein
MARQSDVETAIRAEFALFQTLCEMLKLDLEDRRRMLGLRGEDWRAWLRFLTNGPQPTRPSVAEILLRFAETSFHLTVTLERHAHIA